MTTTVNGNCLLANAVNAKGLSAKTPLSRVVLFQNTIHVSPVFLDFEPLHYELKKGVTFCVEKLLHFGLTTLLHFAADLTTFLR